MRFSFICQAVAVMIFSIVESDNEELALAERLYSNYSGRVLSHLRKTVNDAEIARELCAETYSRVVKYIGIFISLSEEDRIKHLFHISNSVAARHFRHVSRHQTEEFVEDEIPSESDVEKILTQSELNRKMYESIDALPQPERDIFLMKYAEEISVKEIAGIYGMNESTVRTVLQRTREKLRKKLEVYYRD
ncbi:MAG: sigma-70 family RNA polymerase sigma factor [Clostridiales bacterium]|nr:sigma-70 family RNA polymerase sigma factor [Clostridiales bacterium]